MDVVDEVYRLEQPVGKQYSYRRGPELSLELEKVKAEKIQVLENNWNLKSSLLGSIPFEKSSVSTRSRRK